MSNAPLFSGCATALITPFQQDGSLDESALRHLIERQIDAGMDALILLGTTGEPCTLTMNERERVISIGIETACGRIPVIVGTGSNDTRRAMSYALQAQRLGAQGQLTVTPYYNKATQSGLIRHYQAILSCCDLPMILYHVPGRTGMSMHPETASLLASHPNIVGLKEASGSLSRAKEFIEHTDGCLPIYCGNDDQIADMIDLGAKGAISVLSNALPLQTRAITTAALAGCTKEAHTAQDSLLPLIRLLFAQVNPIPVKACLSMLGLIHDELRLPLTPLEEPYRGKLQELIEQMHIHI